MARVDRGPVVSACGGQWGPVGLPGRPALSSSGPSPSAYPARLQCPTCAKCFLSRTELQLHEAFKHRGEKLFVCEECGHRASSRNGLQMHIKAKHRCGGFAPHGSWVLGRAAAALQMVRFHESPGSALCLLRRGAYSRLPYCPAPAWQRRLLPGRAQAPLPHAPPAMSECKGPLPSMMVLPHVPSPQERASVRV